MKTLFYVNSIIPVDNVNDSRKNFCRAVPAVPKRTNPERQQQRAIGGESLDNRGAKVLQAMLAATPD